MDNQYWKRKLLPMGDQQAQDFLKERYRSVAKTTPAQTEIVKDIVSEQSTRDEDAEVFYKILAIGLGTAILLVIAITGLIFMKRRQIKVQNEDPHSSSILVYPSHQGVAAPHFLSNQINFSLPLLKSNSLGDLNKEPEFESDSECDTEAQLLLDAQHNQRSHSFSCYGLGVIEPSLYKSTGDLDELQSWPEGHLGRVWFSLRYEPSTEKLLVSLLKAKNLPSRTIGTVNSCDPFIRLHLMPDERRYLQSKQKKKTCNPYFDETLVFQVSSKDMTDHILKLTVMDGGRPKRRAEIGHIVFPLKQLEIGDGTEQQLFKFDLKKEIEEIKSNVGELLISLVYNENLNRLSVTIIEGKELKFQGEKHEAYVRITFNQHYRGVKEKRTMMAKPCPKGCLSFAEGFNFRMVPSQAEVSNLAFHVFQHTSGYGRDKLIGKCVLGSYMFARGKSLTHWNTVIANPMEPLQQWHTLSE